MVAALGETTARDEGRTSVQRLDLPATMEVRDPS
jgi:hypothetical protein